MSIEILDDSCLLRIFREINDKQTLIICSQVNRRWHSLIFPSTVPEKRFNLGKIKGLSTMKEIIALDGWEIVEAPYEIEPDLFTQHGRKMKQLYIPNMSLDDFKKYVKYLPRLERLHLSSYSGFSKPSERYDGPKLERLEILEICTRSEDWEPYRGLSLMDRCPYLKSAFHNIDGEDFFVDTQVKNYYLEDLVIENMFSTEAVNWPTLKKILRKCPNLKHLAIRHSYDTDIEDENIPEMLELLPKVVLIDLRVSPGVTYISADYVDEYCKLHNRSISFYYTKEHEHDIQVDWPQLSTKKFKSSPGYSFMKYCFLKPFNELPRVMDPIFLLPLLEDDIRNSKTKPNVQEQNLDPDKEEDGSLDLDDSCLFRIFREINDKQTLIICSKVNQRWHSLIFSSLSRPKRFAFLKRRKDGLKIIYDDETGAVADTIQPDFFIKHGRKIKQLRISEMTLDDFKLHVKYLPRLERLHLSSSSTFSDPSAYYDGPKLERLEILEICTESSARSEPYRGLSLMDRCPYLKSAFHCIIGEDFFVDTQVKNYYLQDLVIENDSGAVNWPTLKKILGKCPNIKHLAIRHSYDTDIEDENIPEMLELLPKVVLIDLRVSPGVTYISADYVDEYCKLNNRSISFYYSEEHEDNIKVDWPQLSDTFSSLCIGYSFMKHCFLKPFWRLPLVMDSTCLLPLLEPDTPHSKRKPDVKEEYLDPDEEGDNFLN